MRVSKAYYETATQQDLITSDKSAVRLAINPSGEHSVVFIAKGLGKIYQRGRSRLAL